MDPTRTKQKIVELLDSMDGRQLLLVLTFVRRLLA